MTAGDAVEVFGARRTSFGDAAEAYDAARPSWPAGTVAWMLGSPPDSTVLRVLDLGAGTGKGTRVIARMGHDVVAVEPSDQMRAALSTATGRLPAEVAARIDPRPGGAEGIPVEDGSVDAVTAFQAWHWFDEPVAARECGRVLRPGGWLSMAWHLRDESAPWSRELSEIVDRHEHLADDEDAPALEGFGPAQTRVFDHVMRQSVEDLVLHASTWSFVAIRPDRETVLERVRELGRRVAGDDGMVEIAMRTRCYRLPRL